MEFLEQANTITRKTPGKIIVLINYFHDINKEAIFAICVNIKDEREYKSLMICLIAVMMLFSTGFYHSSLGRAFPIFNFTAILLELHYVIFNILEINILMLSNQFQHHPQRCLFRIRQFLEYRRNSSLIRLTFFSQFEMILFNPKIKPSYPFYHIINLLSILRNKQILLIILLEWN